MKKEFILNIVLLLSINFLVKPLYLFGVDAHIQNIVGPQTYGVYFALFNLVFLFQFIIEPGIQSFNSRNIAQNPDQLGYHLPRILGIKMILFLFFLAAIVVGFFATGYQSDLLPLVLWIGINLFLSTTYIYLRTNIAAVGKYRIDSFLSAFDKLLMLIILGSLSWIPAFREQFTIMWLVYGQFAAYLIACLVALFILRKHLGKISIVCSMEYFQKLIKWSFPFILILLFMSIYNKMDGIMLERMLGDEGLEAGIYAAGYRFVDALNMIGYMMAALLLPMYSSNLKNSVVITDLLHTGLKLIAVCAFVAACVFIFYGKDLLPLIYTEANAYYSEVLVYLMVSFIGVSVAYLYGSLLVANDNLKSFNILLAASVLLNLGLNLYLIPLIEAKGAAIATAITQITVLLGQVLLVYKYTEVRFQPKIYVQVLAFGLLCTLIFKGVQQFSLFWMWGIAISISFSLISALILQLVEVRALLAILKKRPTSDE